MATDNSHHPERGLYLIPKRERVVPPPDPDDDHTNDDPHFDDAA